MTDFRDLSASLLNIDGFLCMDCSCKSYFKTKSNEEKITINCLHDGGECNAVCCTCSDDGFESAGW